MTNLDLPLSDVRFVVVDVESTGGTTGEHRLIEIAMVVMEGGEVVQTYASLVDPHEEIPPFIQRMTGISNAMVKGAPEEDEAVAPVIAALRDPRSVFVAHNVGFDWGFVRGAMLRSSGIVMETTQLCTCKLSRRLHTELLKHDLASVAEYCNVSIAGRHRAMGDTEATATVLRQLVARAIEDHGAETLGDLVALQYVPRTASKRDTKKKSELAPYLEQLPDEPGVYYFLSSKRNVLYVGKARSLAKRVRTYFHDAPLHGRRVTRMLRYIKHIRWETTGTELGALLLESREIKTRQPAYNVTAKDYIAPCFLRITDEDYPRLEVVEYVDTDGAEYFGPFRSRVVAERLCVMMQEAYHLRSCEGGLQPHVDARPCFEYHVKKCLAPCAELQSKQAYQISVQTARDHLADPRQGAASFLQQRMAALADEERFEAAAMYRDGLREIERMMMHRGTAPISVQQTDLVVMIPTSDRYATAELFAIRAGRLVLQRVVGLQGSRKMLEQELRSVYGAAAPSGRFTEIELDELRIITSWLHQHRQGAVVVEVSVEHLEVQIAEAVAEIRGRASDEPPSEFSQIPMDNGAAH